MKAFVRNIATFAFAIFASACAPTLYNAGDPTSEAWVQTRILECLLGLNCSEQGAAGAGAGAGTTPGSGTTLAPLTQPVLAEGHNGEFTALIRLNRSVRAWGRNNMGQLGYNNTTSVGNGVGPAIIAAGDVGVGETATDLFMGFEHICAVLSTGAVRCWGNGVDGILGYDAAANIGDGVGSTIAAAGDVPLGATATQVRLGDRHSCALLSTGAVRCWGRGLNGRLGYGNANNVGSGTTSILAAGDVPIGGTATSLGAGGAATCAILSAGNLRCWGANPQGQLGYGNTTDVGDGGTSIAAAGDVPVGGTVTQVALGTNHTCALLSTGAVRCWGQGTNGRLGYGNTNNVGNGVGVSIITAGDVPVGGTVTQISAGTTHTCALLSTGAVRCWGSGDNGRLGHNNGTHIGDGGLSIIAAGDVPLGGTAVQVVALNGFTCAVLTTGAVRCWGLGANGNLGHNATANIGDGGTSIITAGDIPFQ